VVGGVNPAYRYYSSNYAGTVGTGYLLGGYVYPYAAYGGYRYGFYRRW
jgi:hypothetical protein